MAWGIALRCNSLKRNASFVTGKDFKRKTSIALSADDVVAVVVVVVLK